MSPAKEDDLLRFAQATMAKAGEPFTQMAAQLKKHDSFTGKQDEWETAFAAAEEATRAAMTSRLLQSAQEEEETVATAGLVAATDASRSAAANAREARKATLQAETEAKSQMSATETAKAEVSDSVEAEAAAVARSKFVEEATRLAAGAGLRLPLDEHAAKVDDGWVSVTASAERFSVSIKAKQAVQAARKRRRAAEAQAALEEEAAREAARVVQVAAEAEERMLQAADSSTVAESQARKKVESAAAAAAVARWEAQRQAEAATRAVQRNRRRALRELERVGLAWYASLLPKPTDMDKLATAIANAHRAGVDRTTVDRAEKRLRSLRQAQAAGSEPKLPRKQNGPLPPWQPWPWGKKKPSVDPYDLEDPWPLLREPVCARGGSEELAADLTATASLTSSLSSLTDSPRSHAAPWDCGAAVMSLTASISMVLCGSKHGGSANGRIAGQ